MPVNDRTVNIGADRRSPFSFGAGNLGLPTDQIAIGFSGDDLHEAKAFADATVQKLSTKWHVHEVPQERGALPLSHCDLAEGRFCWWRFHKENVAKPPIIAFPGR